MDKGQKFDNGKARIDLIPSSTLFALGTVFRYGAEKYEDRNWERGIEYGRLFAALMRHMWSWWMGEETDPESGLSHLDHAMCNLSMLKEMTLIHPHLDDRPDSKSRIGVSSNSDTDLNKTDFNAIGGVIRLNES